MSCMDTQRLNPRDIADAFGRREAFLLSLSAATLEAEDVLPNVVRSMNASSRSKLQKIYAVADELSNARLTFVACGKGCASCCHMNVSMTSAEAERLGSAIGRVPLPVLQPIAHPVETFAGVPCPFLDGQGVCSVYEHRPLSCRKHASFFKNNGPCHPSLMNEVEVPIVQFSGLDGALFSVTGLNGVAILADIRDFFPRP